jgi:hypothetical protein
VLEPDGAPAGRVLTPGPRSLGLAWDFPTPILPPLRSKCSTRGPGVLVSGSGLTAGTAGAGAAGLGAGLAGGVTGFGACGGGPFFAAMVLRET